MAAKVRGHNKCSVASRPSPFSHSGFPPPALQISTSALFLWPLVVLSPLPFLSLFLFYLCRHLAIFLVSVDSPTLFFFFCTLALAFELFFFFFIERRETEAEKRGDATGNSTAVSSSLCFPPPRVVIVVLRCVGDETTGWFFSSGSVGGLR